MTPGPAVRRALAAGLLCLAAGLTWWGSLSVPFTYDDFVHLVNNPGMQADDASLGTALFSGFQETRPLYNLTLFVIVRLGGDTPLPFHALSLALHLIATLLCFGLARRLLGRDALLPALAAAALFGLHPVMAETVCYVNSLSGGLSAVLYLAALLGVAPGPERRRPRLVYGLALLAGFCAMLAKESAATLPLAILLLDLLYHEAGWRAGLRHFGKAHWPFLALSLVVVPLLFVIFSSPHRGMAGYDTAPLGHFLLTQLLTLPRFVGLWLWPAGLSLIHLPELQTSLWGWPLLGLLALLALCGVAWRHRQRVPALSFGILFFLLALLPTNSLLPLEDFFSERFLYLPVFGLALAAGALLGRLQSFLTERSRGKLAVSAAAVLVLAPVPYALATVARVQVWQDPLRLWAEAVAETPHSTRARTNLARELGLRKRYREALAVIDPAVRMKPDEIGPRLNRAAARLSLGDARGAIEDYQHATRLAPGWLDPWEGLARAALAAGDLELAEQAAQRALAIDPQSPIAKRVQEQLDAKAQTQPTPSRPKNRTDGAEPSPTPAFLEDTVAGVRLADAGTGSQFFEQFGRFEPKEPDLPNVYHQFLNTAGDQILSLEEHPGSVADEVMIITVRRATAKAKTTKTASTTIDAFVSAKGIRLGTSSEQLIQLLGEPHEQIPGDKRTTVRYLCSEPARCRILSEANLPRYEAEYIFADDDLVYFRLSLPYP